LIGIFACLAAVAIDGDTLRCANVPEANGRVRLARVDTPERGQPGYDEATAALRAMIDGRTVTCRWVDADPRTAAIERHDPFGRRVAFCAVSGRDLSAEILRLSLGKPWP